MRALLVLFSLLLPLSMAQATDKLQVVTSFSILDDSKGGRRSKPCTGPKTTDSKYPAPATSTMAGPLGNE